MANDKNTKTVAINEESYRTLNALQNLILQETGDKWTLSALVQEGISIFYKLELNRKMKKDEREQPSKEIDL